MRRAVLTLGGTAAGLAALFSFKTHAAVSDAAVAPQPSPMSASATPGSSSAGSSPGSPASSPPAAPSSAAATAKPSVSTASSAPAKTKPVPPAPASTPASAKTKPAAGTFTGANENTQYGPVQVQITTNGTKVTAVSELQQPDDSIGANAITQLDAETLAAGNAGIQAVSGATYTSDGYKKSLQSAVDQAGL